MARILIAHKRDPSFVIELIDLDDAEGGYGGTCPRCPWTLECAMGCAPSDLNDAYGETAVHIDHQHPEV